MGRTIGWVEMIRSVVVLDAADVSDVSAFWAGMLGGLVIDDDPAFHCVIDGNSEWRVGVQHAPDHQQPDWPDGAPQQVHLDLHVTDPEAAAQLALSLGARLLQREHDFAEPHGHIVFADPAGHPFCIGWGHPTQDALRRFLDQRSAS